MNNFLETGEQIKKMFAPLWRYKESVNPGDAFFDDAINRKLQPALLYKTHYIDMRPRLKHELAHIIMCKPENVTRGYYDHDWFVDRDGLMPLEVGADECKVIMAEELLFGNRIFGESAARASATKITTWRMRHPDTGGTYIQDITFEDLAFMVLELGALPCFDAAALLAEAERKHKMLADYFASGG